MNELLVLCEVIGLSDRILAFRDKAMVAKIQAPVRSNPSEGELVPALV